jgi:hypothetical protein
MLLVVTAAILLHFLLYFSVALLTRQHVDCVSGRNSATALTLVSGSRSVRNFTREF